MSVKRILIIQTDDVYFLHETLEVLSANARDLEDYEVTILGSPKAVEQLARLGYPLPAEITTDLSKLASTEYDASFNLSLNEAAWQIHSDVNAGKKAGALYDENELRVKGIWSAWFMTCKGDVPFVTFHMRETFRQILGLKKRKPDSEASTAVKTIVVGLSSPDFFPVEEQEVFLSGLVRRLPGIQVLDESEVNPQEHLSGVLYVGPANLKSLLLCDSGARGIFIGSRFQGLNLLPEKEGTLVVTTSTKKMDAQSLLSVIEASLKDRELMIPDHVSLYRMSMENVFGAYLLCLAGKEISYPFYQAHLVLWNYLLAFQEVNIDIVPPGISQLEAIEGQLEVVSRLVRLHDYALSALDSIYRETKASVAAADVVQKHMTTLTEVDGTFSKVSETHPFLRPMIDFYRIRKGQTEGESLLERSQNSLLTYSEENQSLRAFEELLLTMRNRK